MERRYGIQLRFTGLWLAGG